MPITPSADARRAPVLCGLTAAVLLALASPASAREFSLWERIKADPRMAHRDTMTLSEKRALARDYGVENLLPPSPRTTIPVSNCNDAGPGSLRDAVTSASTGDTVDASALTCSTITLTTGTLSTIADGLTIVGPGPDALTITANHASRILLHAGTGTLTLSGMTIREGRFSSYGSAPARGGCIFSTGTVSLGSVKYHLPQSGVAVNDCVVEAHGDGETAFGGGIFAIRGVSVSDSVISGNLATSAVIRGSFGGGVALVSSPYGFASGTFLAKYSEISGNATGGYGGGIYVNANDAELRYSTIAGNSAGGGVGGLDAIMGNAGTASLLNVTISGNSAQIGVGGMAVFANTSTIQNSTITGNRTDGNSGIVGGADFFGGPIEFESSIFSGNLAAGAPRDVSTNAVYDNVFGANNLVGVAVGIVPPDGLITTNNPGLGPLVNNGGRTHTHALLPGSPAIDTGNNSADIEVDQRGPGFPRVIGVAADIGAFERDPDVVLRSGFE